METYKDKAQSFLSKKNEEDKTDSINSTIRNAVVGLTPTLMNFLAGRSAQIKKLGFDRANKFTQGLADEKAVEVDIDGEPILMPEGEAMFRKAYQKKKGGSLADPSNVFATKSLVNKKTGEELEVTVLKDGRYVAKKPDGSFVEYDPTELVKNYGVADATFKNALGEKTTQQYHKNKPEKKTTIAKDQSAAGKAGAGTKEEYDARIAQAKKAEEEASKLETLLTKAKNNFAGVRDTKDPMDFAITVGNMMRNAVGENKLSDAEARQYFGEDYKMFIEAPENYMRSKFGGVIPPKLRANAIATARRIIKNINESKNTALGKTSRSDGLNKTGVKIMQNISGKPEEESLEQEKKRLKGL